MTDTAAVRGAIRASTCLFWVETPSNPLWKISDIAAIGEIAKKTGALYVCDNTTATPVLQSPFKLGADLVLHATTKYLGGHGDVLGGVVVSRTRDARFDRIRAVQASGGAVPSPFTAGSFAAGFGRFRTGCALTARTPSRSPRSCTAIRASSWSITRDSPRTRRMTLPSAR